MPDKPKLTWSGQKVVNCGFFHVALRRFAGVFAGSGSHNPAHHLSASATDRRTGRAAGGVKAHVARSRSELAPVGWDAEAPRNEVSRRAPARVRWSSSIARPARENLRLPTATSVEAPVFLTPCLASRAVAW